MKELINNIIYKYRWSNEHESPSDDTDIFQSVEDEHGSSSSDTLNIEDGSHTTYVSPLASTVIFESVRDEYTTPTKPSTSDNYITYSPIPTNNPSSSLSSDNEPYTGQIPLERPTESVPDAYVNNIPTNSPTSGNNPSISDSDDYGVTDANGQDYTEPDGKPITSASAGEYGSLVTNTDGSVFTETEFIGGQSTASYSGDITTISNDSSNNVTAATENNTQGLVTDGAEQFSASGWGSTQLPDEAIESGVDIFNVSTDMQSEINPITRGTCGLPEGGPMIQQAIPPVTTASRGLIWSTEDKALYFVDVYKPAVSKYTPANGRLVTLNLGKMYCFL